MKVKVSNQKMEQMLMALKPILPQRNKIGYIAARNTRILSEALTEYFKFKNELINKYGEIDTGENGKQLSTISLSINSPNFEKFKEEFNTIKDIEQEISIMTIKYEEVIGFLNGEEILGLDWMLIE